MKFAIIGGTGVYDVASKIRVEQVTTPFGKVEVDIQNIQGKDIIFLARHGKRHNTPPHMINYRANLWALKELGVKFVYATAAVGSCNLNYKPGDIVVFNDFLDFTKLRPVTFYDGKEGVIHASMADPYCQNLRKLFSTAAKEEGVKVAGEGVYVCTEGPRFETPAEIRMYQKIGGDVVGMTNVPEVVLAKELEMCYAAAGIITNWCTGLGEELIKEEILSAVEQNKTALTNLFIKIFTADNLSQEQCHCKGALMKL
jgi:5'-methylthioadenosine phosphorylase